MKTMENDIFTALMQIVTFFNQPANDEKILKAAGANQDPNLLPIIVRIGLQPNIRVGKLANQLGKDHSSTSRQIAKFERQGLVQTVAAPDDRRARAVALTAAGQQLYDRIATVRAEKIQHVLGSVSATEQQAILKRLQQIAVLLNQAK